MLQGLQLEGVHSSYGPSDVILSNNPALHHTATVSPVNNGTWAYDVCSLDSRPTEASQATENYAVYGAPCLALHADDALLKLCQPLYMGAVKMLYVCTAMLCCVPTWLRRVGSVLPFCIAMLSAM